MATPPNFKEGQSTYRPPKFNEKYYGWWKTRMHDFIMAEDSELWNVICDGPYIPTQVVRDLPLTIPKTRKEYTDADRKFVEKNFRTKKILVCGVGHDEYNRIFAFETAKEIWEALQIAHEGTTQVKQSKIDMLTTENKLVRKILSILPSSWESNVNVITEAKDLQELTIDELVGNLKTYEMKRKIDSERREPKKEKNLVLKAESNDSSEKDSDMAYLTKRAFYQRLSSPEARTLQALVAWGDSSSESEDETDAGDNSMMVVESEENEYDSIFALMAQSDDGEDDDNNEVNFRDVQRNLKSYSPKKLMSLANVLIDAYHSLVEDKCSLTLELREAEQTRDDLVVCVVDMKETICELEKDECVLTEQIANIEHERDDLVVVVVDHKETIENFSKEKEALVKRVGEIEEERDDILVVVADLRETIEGLGTESKPGNYRKGKEVSSEAHIRLENELKDGTVKGSSQQWFMDSGCSKHMTGNTMDFLSLKALQGGSVSFGNGKT
ncbi:structural maintenance of chromosomes protein 3-like [Nicotiana sylvestris]|uniref:structural maintenance of chromosomes protein 3-like n=1 Tax=Nicotiana sylvestris TaxID=4096 RepID=UPI00388C8152